MANNRFSSKKPLNVVRVLTGLGLIFAVFFILAYYAPLTEAQSALAKEHQAVSDTKRSVSSQLKLTTAQLEATQKERDGLHQKLSGIDKETAAQREKSSNLFESLASKLKKRVARKQLEVSQDGARTILLIDDARLFRGHQVSVYRQGLIVLCDVAKATKGEGLLLEVVSHAATDTISNPILSKEFKSTWELTAARATGVARALIKCGAKPALVSATGVAHHRPIENVKKTSSGQIRIVVTEPAAP